jgi:hypothetical protein
MMHMPMATASASAAGVVGRRSDAGVIGGVLRELRPDVDVTEALIAVALSEEVLLTRPWIDMSRVVGMKPSQRHVMA